MTATAGSLPESVKKIAVFRPSAVGDFMFALPALNALRAAYPEAEIVYLGRPWHSEFLAGRPGPIDRVLVVPPFPGLDLSVTEAPRDETEAFRAAMVEEHFDLALQMYGGGRYANPLLRSFGALLTVGMRASDAAPLDRWVSYGPWQNRRLQLLDVAALAGATLLPLGRALESTDQDFQEASASVQDLGCNSWVILQPGASDARRRWSPENFAVVADALASEGARIAVHGTAQEAPLVRAVIAAMQAPALDLSGALSLSGLCGLLAKAALLVSNDTGPLHMAAALGTPCVGVYWFGNLIESGPLRQEGHRALISARVACPVCGVENLKQRCTHDSSFVDDVKTEDVLSSALDLFSAVRR
jgi:ADP-heptose:LPS heptosyltransferase